MTKEQPLRIICLEAENVKRLKAVRIKPDKTLVRIEGRNAQGKTSVLDAIAAALGGGKWQPEKPVRDGEKKASVKLDLGELQIERRWTAKGGTSLVVTSDGATMATPQTILDKLVGDLTFDPLAFVRMKPDDQADTLRQLAGLNFDRLDAERAQIFEERTIANREHKRYQAGSEPMPNKPASMEPVDVRQLADKQQEAMAHNRKVDDLEAACKRSAESVDHLKGQISALAEQTRAADKLVVETQTALAAVPRLALADCEAEILQAEEHLRALREKRDQAIAQNRKADDLEGSCERASESAENLKRQRAVAKERLAPADKLAATNEQVCQAVKRINVGDLGAEITKAEAHNKAIEAYERWHEHEADVKEAEKRADGLTDQLTAIDDEKAKALAAAKFPLDGLGVDELGPTLNGIPFSQASSAEQLRTGVAIGLAEKRKARIMLIRDGSLLDGNGLKELNDIAEEFDAQVFVERVAESASPSAVFIQDGEIVE